MSSLGASGGGGARGVLDMLQEARERRDKQQQGDNDIRIGKRQIGGAAHTPPRGDVVSGLMSRPQVPLRVNFFNNGSSSGKRCVLDRAQTLSTNLPIVARRLGVFDFSSPVVYTSGGKNFVLVYLYITLPLHACALCFAPACLTNQPEVQQSRTSTSVISLVLP
jgi:hypothetical protein